VPLLQVLCIWSFHKLFNVSFYGEVALFMDSATITEASLWTYCTIPCTWREENQSPVLSRLLLAYSWEDHIVYRGDVWSFLA